MIGVVCPEGQRNFVAEFFEFFKTPWEFYRPERSYDVLLATDVPPQGIEVKLLVVYSSAGNEKRPISNSRQSQDTYVEYEDTIFPVYGRIALIDPQGPVLLRLRGSSGAVAVDESSHPRRVIHVGYDLFEEVRFLLESGQPKPNARIPTLEIHISMLRNWIVDSGIPLVEIPPTPSGHDFIVCLTHDVDFIRIRDHKFDHTMWGFLRRASVDSLLKAAQGRLSLKKCFRNLKAALSLPAVYFGICKDFWLEDFQKFVELERNFKSTFFFIPYKSVPGEGVNRPHSERRAAAYDVSDEQPLLRHLMLTGHEVGLHGIDAWHSVEKGVAEFNQIEEATGKPPIGIRMHWLCFDETSPQKLEEAGFQYDSTVGYNDAVGYRAGTSQVFRPSGVKHLLELPLHIQDTALFYSGNMDLTEDEAWNLCDELIHNAITYSGVLTVLWHTRSLAPERLWGNFYTRLLEALKARNAWFATASQVVEWFRARRGFSFEQVDLDEHSIRLATKCSRRGSVVPNLIIRIHWPNLNQDLGTPSFTDVPWTGQNAIDIPAPQFAQV